MEMQETLNSQSSLEKEEQNWGNQPAWLQTILQSYSHQNSYGTGTKTEIQTNGTRQRTQR